VGYGSDGYKIIQNPININKPDLENLWESMIIYELSSGWWFQTCFISISYMGCHPSHWRTPSFFKMLIAPPTIHNEFSPYYTISTISQYQNCIIYIYTIYTITTIIISLPLTHPLSSGHFSSHLWATGGDPRFHRRQVTANNPTTALKRTDAANRWQVWNLTRT